MLGDFRNSDSHKWFHNGVVMQNKFIKPVATVIVACLLSVTPGTAWAADTELPVMDESSGVLSSTTLARNDTLTFSFRVTDDVACCSFAFWGLYTVPGTNVDQGRVFYGGTGYGVPNRVSGNALDGRYSHSLQIPNDIAAGTYFLKVQLQDNVTRYKYLGQIATITVTVPSVNAGAGASAGTASGTNPASSTVDSQAPGVLVSDHKKVVKRNSVLKSLGITKGKKETISFKVSKNSKKVCSVTSAGIKPKKAGTCEVTVTKTSAKKQKTKLSFLIGKI